MSDQTDKIKTIATLGGFPLLASSPVRWRLIEGVTPCIEKFDMVPADAEKLLAVRGPVKLVMTSNDSTITVEGLYVIGAAAGPNPFIARVEVADRRYWWKYAHVGPRRYNMRRKVGERYIANWAPAQLRPSLPDFAFAPYSTRNPTTDTAGNVADRWDADGVLFNVLGVLDSFERKNFSNSFGEPIRNGDPFGTVQLIEDLEIDDKGDAAIGRAVKACPGLGIFVNLAGKVVLFSKTSGLEVAAIAALGPQMITGGVTKLVRNNLIRPREVHVLFTREIEVRFDYNQQGGTRTVNERFMDNVLPIPDDYLEIPSGSGKRMARGTYIRIEDAYSVWGALPECNLNLASDGARIMEMSMTPHNSLNVMAGLAGVLNVTGAGADWAGRIQALQTHWRQTFRVNRRWMDRIFQLRAFSVGTVDQATGQRAPARAYADHCYFPSKKSLFKQAKQILTTGLGDLTLCQNVDGLPASGLLDGTEAAAPAKVTIPDQDQGILHTDYVTDTLRDWERVLPSKLDTTNLQAIPTGNIADRTRSISFDSVPAGGKRPKMSSTFRIAIIVTAIPAAPNNEQQLHRIVVKPSDVRPILPGSQNLGLESANGPILEIRVPAATETARIPWIDANAVEVEKAFGIRDGIPNFGDYCINEKTGSQGSASLNAIALAEAASAYATFVDRNEGTASGMLNASVTPGGWLAEVVHEIGTDGVAKTSVNLPAQIPALTLWNYLDKGTRKVLMHSVERAA